MYISDVAIELTGRCNLKCEHCLRGPAQRKDISRETLLAFFQAVDSIDTLTLTGGEPSLVPHLIQDDGSIVVEDYLMEIYDFQ